MGAVSDRLSGLNPREREAAMLLAGGWTTDAEIAARMGCATQTVKNHLHNIYRKLGVKNRVELALLVAKGSR